MKVQLLAPHQVGFLTEVHDAFEEALEHRDPEPLPDTGQAGVIRQRLVEGVPEVPAMGEIEGGGLNGLALGADPFEEHDELELEEHERVDRGTAALGVTISGGNIGLDGFCQIINQGDG